MTYLVTAARFFSTAILAAALLSWSVPSRAQEGVFLTEDEAPRAVFPDADRFERLQIAATDALRDQVRGLLDGTTPSIWEAEYVVFTAFKGETELGRAFLIEEIGKHRPITFIVGVRADGHVQDVAVVAYREAYGGQVRSRRFLVQYRDKKAGDSLQPTRVITNIAGATLSVEAASRAVKKALAVARATRGEAGEDKDPAHAALAR